MPITAADVEDTVRATTATLAEARDAAWDDPAGAMDWSCWETVEHIADNFFFYAAQLGPRVAGTGSSVPFAWAQRRPGGPGLVLYADRDAGPAGLLRCVDACGALLAAMVRTTPPDVRSHHDDGVLDTEGFAAMAIGETLVHMHDVTTGLGLPWTPQADLCARLLARFFPGSPTDTDPWATLLWATGRGDLPGHRRQTDWRWGVQPSG
ncbi:Mycothiol maleylpyruvate isomerase N-terminal domain-containing protein [Amycolatopsis pretoriensis]|uniref:Mycothiol maleylpyruvate isomerase N-terminal domain-containing protein n=1 Tax=Amycolatopsis pretoriensis TaxID=218821 RepID=A0A1H5QCF2_9PSEU|nr:maleylpyruvate isomerase N-terminal domain-containing protein [Amycolatopsis pretoriensis]SEF23803.1 Mycothiol maleylpyruvate isomerase N-terminal domain-containing protein [Amycolatopsis pretoriensis]